MVTIGKEDVGTVLMVLFIIFVVGGACLLNGYFIGSNTCSSYVVEKGLLEHSKIRDLRIDGSDYYVDNIFQWDLSEYWNHNCEITFMSGCGQNHIVGIKIMQS